MGVHSVWLLTFFQKSFFVFSRTNTFIKVWNYLRLNYPFKTEGNKGAGHPVTVEVIIKLHYTCKRKDNERLSHFTFCNTTLSY